MECFGFSCRFKVPNILKRRRGDPEPKKNRKGDKDSRYYEDADNDLRNGIWRAVSQAVESSKIPRFARTFNDWFRKHVPGHQHQDNSTAPPWERSPAIVPGPPDVRKNSRDIELVEDFATTSRKQDKTSAIPKPRVSRVKHVSTRRLSEENLDEGTTGDQVQQSASLDLSDNRKISRSQKTAKKVSKVSKKDRNEHEGQYFGADGLMKDSPFHQGKENVSLHSLEKLPPIQLKPSAVVVKKRKQKKKVISEKLTTQQPAEPKVTPQQSSTVRNISSYQDCTDGKTKELDQSLASQGHPVEYADEATARAQVLSSTSPVIRIGDNSPERETEEEEYSDTPEWKVIMVGVSGIKGILQTRKKGSLRVKKGVRFLVDEDQYQDSLSKFLRSRDDKASKPLYRSQYNEAWPLQKKQQSEARRPLYRTVEKNRPASDTTYARKDETRIRIKGSNRYSKPQPIEKANANATEIDDIRDFDVDEAIVDILRNMGELP